MKKIVQSSLCFVLLAILAMMSFGCNPTIEMAIIDPVWGYVDVSENASYTIEATAPQTRGFDASTFYPIGKGSYTTKVAGFTATEAQIAENAHMKEATYCFETTYTFTGYYARFKVQGESLIETEVLNRDTPFTDHFMVTSYGTITARVFTNIMTERVMDSVSVTMIENGKMICKKLPAFSVKTLYDGINVSSVITGAEDIPFLKDFINVSIKDKKAVWLDNDMLFYNARAYGNFYKAGKVNTTFTQSLMRYEYTTGSKVPMKLAAKKNVESEKVELYSIPWGKEQKSECYLLELVASITNSGATMQIYVCADDIVEYINSNNDIIKMPQHKITKIKLSNMSYTLQTYENTSKVKAL